ncbi:E3 ubiquitin-protein ligase RNF25 [Teleopsis dalmanni]|uniref:E3 ubiquitin-protein ligase RNF25 n=1 Tax=Teleopsis dalmanni TaxID=139649 RepID=UPI0018CCC7CC|nr:E3 ubiquitin-protein ligase RNF25 [Teleopsis dalmanni]
MDVLQDEVESLEAILMEDVNIIKNTQSGVAEVIETTVFPVMGDSSEQSICVTLQVLPKAGYPDVSPEFKLLRPRGLDDARLNEIKAACSAKLLESLGFPIVFDLIEVVRENLTDSHLPSGQCVICLYGFCEGDEFTRTECFHYLHSYCLGRHLNALRRNYREEFDKLPAWLQKTADPFQAACPVCREPIKDEADSLKCAMPPTELENAPDFKVTRELQELQQRMSSLFLQQKSRGAIIDIEAETAAVISIETEAEMRRRLQRKAEAANVRENSTSNATARDVNDSVRCNENLQNDGANNMTDSKKENMTKPSSSASPTGTQPIQREPNELTNNCHQHHNRRHYRGGRRHQHHHHHHRDREGDRDRENNHSGVATNSSTTNTNVNGSKHSKSQNR